MTDAEISRRLALAIGWSDADPEDPDVVIFCAPLSGQYLEDHCAVWFEQEWRTFAWGCYFSDGLQGYYHKSYEGSAVAVRLIPLEE
jgi:hypothetical protein